MKTLYSSESVKLGKWLREQREAKGLTMRQLGDLLGKPHSFVAKTECGQRRLDVVEFVWYCNTIEIDAVEGLKQILNFRP